MVKCFVCESEVKETPVTRNTEINLPVCKNCKDTKREKEKVDEFLDSLADGLVCGCI